MEQKVSLVSDSVTANDRHKYNRMSMKSLRTEPCIKAKRFKLNALLVISFFKPSFVSGFILKRSTSSNLHILVVNYSNASV